jgi:hypothetical protein
MIARTAGATEMFCPLYKIIRLYTQEYHRIRIHNSQQLQITVPSVSLRYSGGIMKQGRQSIPILNTSAMQVWAFTYEDCNVPSFRDILAHL